jgi:hypothetical protein
VRVRHLLGAIVVALCVMAPIAEAFDSWDRTLQDGNDTEANVVVAAVCVGIVLTIAAPIVIGRLRALAPFAGIDPAPFASHSCSNTPRPLPAPATSPPIPLRI